MRSLGHFESLDDSNKFLNLLARATEELGTSLDFETTIKAVCRLPVPLLAEWSVLLLRDESGSTFESVASHHQNHESALHLEKHFGEHGREFLERASAFEAVRLGEPVLSEIPTSEIPSIRRSIVLSLPLRRRAKISGVLCLGVSVPGHFPCEDILIAQDLAQRSAIAIENAQLYQNSREAERRLSEAKRILEEANRFKTQFLANMSHEIRTPLGAILGFVEFLLMPDQPEKDRRELSGRIRSNGQHLLRLIDDILNLSKVESGKLEVQVEEIDLSSLMSEVESTMMWTALEKNIRFEVRLRSPVPSRFLGDQLRLQQIFTNVVGNALKFTDRGSVELEASFDSETGILSFDICDTGIGIAPEHVSRLFQPFTQADASLARRYGGTGLGLALSKKIALMLKGDLELLRSEPGRGSHFRLLIRPEIPAKTPLISSLVPTVAAEEQVGAEPSAESLSLDGARILIIDDSPDNQVLISRILSSGGALASIAASGEKALEAVAAQDFDLILTDIQMPGKDGYQTTRELRAMGFGGPVIALTAHALPEERERCLEAGCDEHMAKPIARQALLKTVHRMLCQRRKDM